MSLALIILVAVAFAIIFAQFGTTLPASNSLLWWATGAFLLFAVVYPSGLRPIASFLGIELVSNFVLSSLITFLFIALLVQSSITRDLGRQQRELISSLSAGEVSRRSLFADRASDLRAAVLVTLPCFNEEDNIPSVIDKLKDLPREAPQRIDFLIVNDGSHDTSEALLKRLAPNNHVTHPINTNVAGVLLTGFKVAAEFGYDYVVQCDADGQHPVADIPRLVSAAVGKQVDLLIGSRFLHEGAFENLDERLARLHSTTIARRIGGKLLQATLLMFGKTARISDPTSGFRVYSRDAFTALMLCMPEEYPEPESIALLLLKGKSVAETPASMTARQGGVSSIAGLKTIKYMGKVTAALIGLRLRSLSP